MYIHSGKARNFVPEETPAARAARSRGPRLYGRIIQPPHIRGERAELTGALHGKTRSTTYLQIRVHTGLYEDPP